MTIQLPQELESSVRAEVLSGHFASENDMVAAAIREYFRQHGQHPQAGDPTAKTDPKALGSIGAMRDAADELDEIVADTRKRRRKEPERPPLTPDELNQRLLASGLITQLPDPTQDIDDEDDLPITIPGEPLSETIIRERR